MSREPLAAMAVPVTFDRCAGWFHPAAGRLGIVLCGPIGYEALCTHRQWHRLARTLAAAGLATLRFDYRGTGDSAEDDEAPARVPAWLDSVHGAIGWLRAHTGVERIALVGLRLGAALAAAAAQTRDDIDQVALLAPAWGPAYARELRALSRMAAVRQNQPPPAGGGLEAAGFVYTAETLAALKALDPGADRAPAPRILVLARPDAPAEAAVADQFRALGAAVDTGPFDDYRDVMRDADQSTYPEAGFGAVVGWLAAANIPGTAVVPPAALPLRLPEGIETAVRIDGPSPLHGILCRPASASPRQALLFLNTGANHHVGTSRMTVTMARRLAQLGFPSLRLDTGGLGDSPPTSVRPDGVVRGDTLVADMRAALDWLERQGHRAVILIGLCSGACAALQTATDRRVAGLLLLNLQGYWQSADTPPSVNSTRYYLKNARRLQTWLRVVRGEVAAGTIARALLARVGTRLAAIVQGLGARGAPGATLRLFRTLSARGVTTLFVYVESDPGLDELELTFGRGGGKLAVMPGVRFEIIEEGDHVFSLKSSRERLYPLIEAHLEAGDAPSGGTTRSAVDLALARP